MLPALSCKVLGKSAGITIPVEVCPGCLAKSSTMFVSSATFFNITKCVISVASSGEPTCPKSLHALAGTSLLNSIVKRLVLVTSSLNTVFTFLTCLSNSLGNSPLRLNRRI
jgi:hypothetical protein